MKSPCQGQRAGRCRVSQRAERVIRPGMASSRRRIVSAATKVAGDQEGGNCPSSRWIRRRASSKLIAPPAAQTAALTQAAE